VAWAVTADPDRFDEAVEWFEARFPVTEELLEELGTFAGPRAWTIANVAQLDIVLFVWEAIRDAIADGTTLEDFKATVREKLTEAWGTEKSGRIETIFRTNVQSSYNRGRFKQMRDPDVVAIRPFWMFDAILDSRTTKVCNDAHKTVLPQDDAFWDTHVPPLHFNCRSSIRSLTKAQAERRGITKNPPDDEASEGFGAAPTDEDEWQPERSKYPQELWAVYERKHAERA
jgi:SPP1 gp7 family putative phage head morphogenesis protein